jgi:hypothetical protein
MIIDCQLRVIVGRKEQGEGPGIVSDEGLGQVAGISGRLGITFQPHEM